MSQLASSRCSWYYIIGGEESWCEQCFVCVCVCVRACIGGCFGGCTSLLYCVEFKFMMRYLTELGEVFSTSTEGVDGEVRNII